MTWKFPFENQKKALWFLLTISFLIRLIYLLCFDNYFYGDATARLFLSWDWSLNPVVFPNPDWLPLHFYLLGSIIKITGDILIAPRILGLVLGSLSVIPFYLISKKLFNPLIAFATALIFCFHGTHILLSIITLSSVPFLFFTLWGLYFLLRYLEKPNFIAVVSLALCLGAAALLRFEGWMLICFLSIAVVKNLKQWKLSLVYLFVVSLAPLWVMYMTYLEVGNPLRGLIYSDQEVMAYLNIVGTKAVQDIFHTSIAFAPGTWLIGIAGMVFCFTQKKNRGYVLLLGAISIIVYNKLLNQSLLPEFRYFITLSVLMLPLFTFGLFQLLERFSNYLMLKNL